MTVVLHLAKLSFKNEGEIRIFPQNLKEFVTSRPVVTVKLIFVTYSSDGELWFNRNPQGN